MARLYRKRRILPSLGGTVIAWSLVACEAPPPEPKLPPSYGYSGVLQQAEDAMDAVNANEGNKQRRIDELFGRDQPAAR